jgi:hypothetical protein
MPKIATYFKSPEQHFSGRTKKAAKTAYIVQKGQLQESIPRPCEYKKAFSPLA